MQGIDGARIHQRFLEMAYIEGDQAAVARETLWYAGKREEYLSFGLQAANRNVLGQRLESSKLYKRAADTALRQGLRDVVAGFDEADARADALSGNCRTVRRLGRPALALAMCGDTAQAEKLVGGDVEALSEWHPLERGATAGGSRGSRAPARPPQSGGTARICLALRARVPGGAVLAWLGLSESAKGRRGRGRVPEDRGSQGRQLGSTWLYPNWGLYYSLSHLGMARGFVVAGDTAKANKAFQDFFALWKDADTNIPILQQARAEFAKLR